eukprot:TRINITY_DN9606_c0_g2_i1.p1 TRINITY_DN9606_c0_g2~~TRINITY_DN9606_c0_g2_i1.p1  ORF type:complete len:527 (+),score=161.38 TRINITY_DN9606_c0_g2_i1:110-1690(+)
MPNRGHRGGRGRGSGAGEDKSRPRGSGAGEDKPSMQLHLGDCDTDLTWHEPPPFMHERPDCGEDLGYEECAQTVHHRIRQIEYTQRQKGFQMLLAIHAADPQASRNFPVAPDPRLKHSKRGWERLLRQWRDELRLFECTGSLPNGLRYAVADDEQEREHYHSPAGRTSLREAREQPREEQCAGHRAVREQRVPGQKLRYSLEALLSMRGGEGTPRRIPAGCLRSPSPGSQPRGSGGRQGASELSKLCAPPQHRQQQQQGDGWQTLFDATECAPLHLSPSGSGSGARSPADSSPAKTEALPEQAPSAPLQAGETEEADELFPSADADWITEERKVEGATPTKCGATPQQQLSGTPITPSGERDLGAGEVLYSASGAPPLGDITNTRGPLCGGFSVSPNSSVGPLGQTPQGFTPTQRVVVVTECPRSGGGVQQRSVTQVVRISTSGGPAHAAPDRTLALGQVRNLQQQQLALLRNQQILREQTLLTQRALQTMSEGGGMTHYGSPDQDMMYGGAQYYDYRGVQYYVGH